MGDTFRYPNVGIVRILTSEAKELFQNLKQKVEDEKNPQAMFELASFYKEIMCDISKAVEWYEKSAAGNCGRAAYQLAVYYDEGWTCNGCMFCGNDKEKAINLYTKAVDLGIAEAASNLAVIYRNGDGVTKDEKKAFELYQKAAELGDTLAINALAMYYMTGEVVEKKDEEQAFKYFQQAADKGNAGAMYNVALCYLKGTGVGRDPQKAYDLCKKAAENGSNSAEIYLEYFEQKAEEAKKSREFNNPSVSKENPRSSSIDSSDTREESTAIISTSQSAIQEQDSKIETQSELGRF